MQQTNSPTLQRRALATTLFLFALYWLTASGAFHSIDEHAVFAVSRNLVLHGEWNQSTLFWDVPYIDQALIGTTGDGELYAKYGIGHSLVVALAVALGWLIPGAKLATTAMLTGSVATALTGGFLVLAAGRLGYSERVGVTLGLIFGGATFAWVYAKTMFSEPLVALGLIVVVWLLLGGMKSLRLLVAGSVLGMTIAIRPASILVVPLFILPLWTTEVKLLIRRLIAFGLPQAICVAALLAFNLWRFNDPLQFGYSERFDGSLLTGLTGFLFSLDRSIFIFAPPLVALFWSVPTFMRRHTRWGITLLAIPLLSLFIYSLWPVFWGGPVWGPRYLLPVLPLLMLLLAPAVEKGWQTNAPSSPHPPSPPLPQGEGGISPLKLTSGAHPQGMIKRRFYGVALTCLIIIGIAMQLPGVLWNSLPETQALGQRYPLWLLSPHAEWIDVAWVGGAWQGALSSSGLLLLALAALRWPKRALLTISSLSSLVGSFFLLIWLAQSGLGYASPPISESLLSACSNDFSRFSPVRGTTQVVTTTLPDCQWLAGDALLLNPAPYQEPIAQLIWAMNEPELTTPLYGIYRKGLLADTKKELAMIEENHQRLWLLTQGAALGDPESSSEQFLALSAALVSSQWLAEGYRLTLFESLKAPTHAAEPEVTLAGLITLKAWQAASPGASHNSLQLTLHWEALAPLDANLHTFAQLLNQEGQLISAWDNIPQAAFAPTPSWQPNQPIQEQITLTIPPDTPPGTLQLIVGLYDPNTGERLLTDEGEDAVRLMELEQGLRTPAPRSRE
jgi:hypothetical protein